MKNLNKKKTITLVLVILLLVITIGYAYLSANLNIGGNSNIKGNKWDIHFENINVKTGSVITETPLIDADTKQTISYSVTLDKPGDYYEFTTSIVNAGTIDGKLSENTNLIGPKLTDEQSKYLAYTVTYENGNPISKGDLLKAGDYKNVKVRVEYKKEIEKADLPKEDSTLNLKFHMEYVQDDGAGKDVDTNIKTAVEYLQKIATDNNADPTSIEEIGNTGLAYDGTSDNNLRYIGANPNNYVLFNNELWRIIGVMNNVDDGSGTSKSSTPSPSPTSSSPSPTSTSTSSPKANDKPGKIESRVKLIKADYYSKNIEYDNDCESSWKNASLQKELNGIYLNSLSKESQDLIDNVKLKFNHLSADSAIEFYNRERTAVANKSDEPQSWVGKVSLMYASDYAFAMAGGTTTSRTSCLNKVQNPYNSQITRDCYQSDWLSEKTSNNTKTEWTMTGDDYEHVYFI